MILADKIINERKKLGLSQEELAEQLSVSRQSISKWEGAQSVPDLSRIIRMAEIFGVSTDYLLKDEIEVPETSMLQPEIENTTNVRKVSMEEASAFVSMEKRHAPIVATGVSLCITSPIILLILTGLIEGGRIGLPENTGSGIGIVALLIQVAVGVCIFVKSGLESSRYEYLEKEEIDTEYGVDGMAREGWSKLRPAYNRNITLGVILCIISAIPLIMTSLITEDDGMITVMVGLLLAVVAVAVNLFVRSGMMKETYDKLLQEGDYTVGRKRTAPVLSRVSTIYWLLVTAAYLALSFITNSWHMTWIVWPVAGVTFAVVITVTKMIIKAED